MKKIKSNCARKPLSVAAIMALSLASPASEAAMEPASTPAILILDPMKTAPLVTGSPDSRSDLSQHRRVISKPNQRSVNLDVGYNIYKAGAGSAVPYAYDKDELCYFPSGSGRFVSDGEEVLTRAGDMMWRPARAATQSGRALTDMVTICAFTPARDDDWGHKLPGPDVGKWSGDPNKKPKVRWFHIEDATIVSHPGDADHQSGAITERMLLRAQTDGVKGADVTLTTYKAGLVLPARTNRREQICWLESGEMKVATPQETEILSPNFFLYSPVGSRFENIEVLKDSTLLCFTEPARPSE